MHKYKTNKNKEENRTVSAAHTNRRQQNEVANVTHYQVRSEQRKQ